MDFFERQDVARRNTGRLTVLFILAIISIIAAIYCVISAVFIMSANNASESGYAEQTPPQFFRLDVFVIVALATIGIIALGSLYKMAQLRGGGEVIALMLGGRRLDPGSGDPVERQLLNVVEEMAIASGVPVPPVFVMDHERGINAFAAGYTPGDAVIGVTRGCLELLNREELQGVMAHEFSHILNGDMRLNIRLMGLLNGILVIAIIGWYVMRAAAASGGGNRKGNSGGIVLVGLGLVVIGSVGLLFGKLIKAAISRQREFLADASAVQFTRSPDGIGGALKKIGATASRIEDPHAEEASHMFFGASGGSSFTASIFSLFSTHPPLTQRIQRIDPSFKGDYPKQVRREGLAARIAQEKAAEEARRREQAHAASGARKGPLDGVQRAIGTIDPTGMLESIGTATAGGMLVAAALIDDIPAPLRSAAHEPFGARAVVYALLLDDDMDVRKKQLDALSVEADPAVFEQTLRLISQLGQLSDDARIPLVEMANPALRNLSPPQYETFRKNVETLSAADGRIDLFEYTIRMILLRDLDMHFGLSKPPKIRHHSVASVRRPIQSVLSVIAHAGASDADEVAKAYHAGASQTSTPDPLLGKSECSLKMLDAALQEVAACSPQVKKRIMQACTACIMADQEVTPREGELLRAVAGAMGVPVPPLSIGGASGGQAS